MFNFLGISPSVVLGRIIILLICLPAHELAHAWTAHFFGDDTPEMNGRLSFNPAVHLDIMGVLVFLFVGFGWAKPVPVNPYVLRKRSPYAMMWVSLAGPLANLVLAILGGLLLRFDLIPQVSNWPGFLPTPYQFLFFFVSSNILLMLFNLIPLSPLDGEKVADSIFPPSWQRFMDQIRPYSPIILMAIVFVLPMIGIDILGWILYPAMNAIIRLIIGV
jgi:Zn-dependent protease